ncbi:hypothetical protein B0T21DRAFT_25592 [Apiosordaria backusii]|uniref:Uncharacterized protein n=1 Tax=Apiosordaria backusii TaxID=314023 RepID=A0AA40K7B1_9PEZI|nr:hypothetical protein B0T21DRAFT_25592 [Apiosordaria backusii]
MNRFPSISRAITNSISLKQLVLIRGYQNPTYRYYHPKSTMTMPIPTPDERMRRFKEALSIVYGPFDNILSHPDPEASAASWRPPSHPGAGGHLGRYLWTDAFGVVNFITLSKELSCPHYLTLAKRLVTTVHETLGRTRDLSSRLPGATDSEPLKGGLRIGKIHSEEEDPRDGDGQYHHYLTLWMFALNRLALATGEKQWSLLAVQLAKAVHNKFVIRNKSNNHAERMVWKMSTDLSRVLVPTEGHLDAATGFVVYRLLQRTAEYMHGPPGDLVTEIADYRLLMGREGKMRVSNDCLDLGMGLWICHFFRDEDWARTLGSQSLEVGKILLAGKRGIASREANRRLAFREFGACLGLRCYGCGPDQELKESVKGVLEFWQRYLESSTDEDLKPISLVMYAAAGIPGAFEDGYLGRE